jgi:hypothetical protein
VLKVLDLALKDPEPKSSVYERCYIVTSQATTWKETSNAFAKLLYKQGVVKSPEAKSVSLKEAGTGELSNLQAGSMLLENGRAKRLGWKPVKEGILEYLAKEVEAL